MRIPNSFVPKKELNKNIEQLFKGPKEIENPFALQELLENCQEYSEREDKFGWGGKYNLGVDLASNIDYNKSHLEKLSQEIILEEHEGWIGLHFSALINKIITKQDTINLTFNREFDCLGSYLNKGTLIIQGDVGDSAGYCMKGGKLIVKGNAGESTGEDMQDGQIIIERNAGEETGSGMQGGKMVVKGNAGLCAGNYMQNGEIIVEGNAGEETGYEMEGGKITVKGKIEEISETYSKGTIIQGNKILRP